VAPPDPNCASALQLNRPSDAEEISWSSEYKNESHDISYIEHTTQVTLPVNSLQPETHLISHFTQNYVSITKNNQLSLVKLTTEIVLIRPAQT
jgi:hypothetical protein